MKGDTVMECSNDDLITFMGMTVVSPTGVKWWMGTTEDGLQTFIDRHKDAVKSLSEFSLYKNGEFVGKLGEYMK